MQELIAKIEQWAEDRNLINGSTPIDQAMKLFSEFGELADAVAKDDFEGVKDGIGDVFVVMTIIFKQKNYGIFDASCNPDEPIFRDVKTKELIVKSGSYLSGFIDHNNYFGHAVYAISCLKRIVEQYNLNLQQCVQHAYNDIKDRKGIMHNGVFIKESDPRYAELVK